MGDPVHVAWIFDDNVSLEASVAVVSVIANAGADRAYVLHLFVYEVNPDRLAAITRLCRRNIDIRVHHLHARSFASPKLVYSTQMQLERIALGRHLPDVKRVVYLDTDLVAERDIAEIYDTDLEECAIGAVVDLHIERQFMLGRAAGTYPNLKIYFEETLSVTGELQKCYFNTGVLILDLGEMRAQKIEDSVRSILNDGLELLIPDQCVLNMLMLPQAKLLDSRWNVLVPSTRLSLLLKQTAPDRKRWRDLADPFILHFAGGKPWHHRSRPKASCWWAYAMASPLRHEIISSFWTSHGRNMFSTARSKLLAPLQMAIGRRQMRRLRDDESKCGGRHDA